MLKEKKNTHRAVQDDALTLSNIPAVCSVIRPHPDWDSDDGPGLLQSQDAEVVLDLVVDETLII